VHKTSKIPVSQLLLQYSNTALNILFPLILFPYMTRALGPGGYGVIGFYESITLVVNVWAAFGVNYYGLRLLSKSAIGDLSQANTVLHLLLINLTMASIGVLMYFIYVLQKHVQIGSLSITLLYGYIMVIYMLHADWYFQSQENYSFLLKRTFLLRLFMVVTTLLFVHRPQHLIYYIVISAINYSLLAGSAIWHMRHLFKQFSWDGGLFKRLLKSMWPFALLGVLSSLYFTVDTILLARTGKIPDLGQYTVAAKIVRLGLNVFIGASIVFFVKLFRNAVDKRLQQDSLLMTIHFSIPIGALLFFFASPTIRFVSGEHYLPAITLLRIFSLLWVVVPIHDFFNIQVLMVHHKERLLIYLYAAATVLSVVLNLVMIPIWFTTGAAIAILITETAVLFAAILFARPYFQLTAALAREFAFCITAYPLAMLCAQLAGMLTNSPFLQLTTGITAFFAGYLFFQLVIFKNDFYARIYKLVIDSKKHAG
jgi:O-antigen/teichoic acid export membrane protein